ncbi:hypothetical protein AVEN_244250-1, partial [Araneus ventricosus]
RNPNPKVACLKRKEDEKNEEITKDPDMQHLIDLFPQVMARPSQLDEDGFEIISRDETESIPSELLFSPPLPPKNGFKFGGKPSCFASLSQKKEGRKHSLSPRNSARSESSGNGESESQESSFSSAVSSGSNTEMKENPSFNKQTGQESSNKCLGGSKDESQGSNPTVSFHSSFTKYLEKNPESEWLAPGKSSEQSLPAGNNSKERVVPIFVQELDQ